MLTLSGQRRRSLLLNFKIGDSIRGGGARCLLGLASAKDRRLNKSKLTTVSGAPVLDSHFDWPVQEIVESFFIHFCI